MHDARLCLSTGGGVDRDTAASVAAARVLEFLFPQEADGRFQALMVSRLAPGGADLDKAHQAGEGAALAAIARAIDDGADALWDVGARPPATPATWRATPPVHASNPVEPLAGQWRPWVLKDGGEVQPPPPPAYGSSRYRQEMEEVLAVARNLTDAQKAVADRWHLDQGTVTPVGVWNRITLDLVRRQRLPEDRALEILAAVNVAMMDASIACWSPTRPW